jgi:hypothetical protein
MASDQFDEFWNIRCPKCNETIDLEILVNFLKKKIEVAEKE